MVKYYSFGGAPNPNFRYKAYVRSINEEMLFWCDNYGDNYKSFNRYYINWTPTGRAEEIEFQFEQEEPAILFSLKFAHK